MPPLASRIGAMRESLTLQRNAELTSTGTGFKTANWATYATVAGEYLEPAEGRESWQQGAVVAHLGPKFRIRYRTDVVPKHRLLWRGQTLQIHAVIPEMRVGNRFLLVETGLTQ
jgi:SPP1 family predicted phage head-tail adaptor